MPVRESLNKHPKKTTAAAVAIVLDCVSIAWIYARPARLPGPAKSFYTTDDSSQAAAMAALFDGDWDQWPPFDHGGKQAVRALLFSADGESTKFIGYLEKLSPEGQQLVRDLQADSAGRDPDKLRSAEYRVAEIHTLVKKPGTGDWLPELPSSPESRQAMALTPPPGEDAANLRSVFP